MDVLTKVIHRGRLNKRSVTALISVGAFNGENNKEIDRKCYMSTIAGET